MGKKRNHDCFLLCVSAIIPARTVEKKKERRKRRSRDFIFCVEMRMEEREREAAPPRRIEDWQTVDFPNWGTPPPFG